MKKLIFVALTLLAVLPGAQAGCTFDEATTDNIRSVMNAGGGWRLTDAQCALLNGKKLSVMVTGMATVLDGTSVAWASVRLMDSTLNIGSDAQSSRVSVNAKEAGMDVANNLLYGAVSDAVKQLDFAKAAREVEAYRAKAAATFKQPAKR